MSANIISFVIVLGVLIFAHELGHFLLAKLMGVGVEKFSLGFGPRIFGKKIGMTEYRISWIPLGGYVKMVGEEPDTELDDSLLPLSFSHKGLFRRSMIVLAGPAFNLLLSVVISPVISLLRIRISLKFSVLAPLIGGGSREAWSISSHLVSTMQMVSSSKDQLGRISLIQSGQSFPFLGVKLRLGWSMLPPNQ